MLPSLLVALLLPLMPLPADADPPADLLFVGGPVRTLEADQPLASALAVVGDRIAWVGDAAQAGRWRGPDTRVIELDGRCLLPGFTDAHLHLEGYADLLAEVDLVGTASYEDVVARVVARAAGAVPGAWIVGFGWDQNDWDDSAFPVHDPLSAALPDHPVVLRRIDGHALLANAAALAAAGVDGTTPVPDGGRMLRDPDGAPTGVLIDNAMALVLDAVPDKSEATRRARLPAAIAALHAHGITSVHDAGVPASTVALYAALDREGRFPLRVHVMLSAGEPALRADPALTGWPTPDLLGDGRIAVRAIKAYADGALGSRGAALLADYADDTGNRGLLLTTPEALAELARFAVDGGWQLCTHAIGTRANRLVLDTYEETLSAVDDGPARRFRVEHAQVLAPADIPRFAALGVLPSMQAQHCTSDMPWAGRRLGPVRERGAYAWRALLDTGVILPGGSDCPVEEPDPIAAFHAAVTRQDAHARPEGGWHPEQCMTREEALAHLTRWPAYAAFREDDLGSLAPGKRADLVVLSGDPLGVPDDALLGLSVELTVFDGLVVFSRGATPAR